MTEPKPLPSETKLVERLREAQWDEAKHRPAFNRAIADGAPVEVLEQVEEVAKLCAEAAAALASLADELRLAREALKQAAEMRGEDERA